MKKRLIAVLAGVLVLGALVIPKAFAHSDARQGPQMMGFSTSMTVPTAVYNQQDSGETTPSTQTTEPGDFYNQMFDWHKSWVDNAEKNDQITPEQAQAWKEHFDYMKDFHSKNGMGMMGGFGNGGMMGGFGNGGMMGGGMMGGF